MLQLNLVVAARARLRRHGLLPMRLMTRQARLIGMNGDRRVIPLWRMVTAQTILWTLEVPSRSTHVLAQLHGLRCCKLMTGDALFGFAGARVMGGQIVTRHTKLSCRTPQLFTGGIVTLCARKPLIEVELMPRRGTVQLPAFAYLNGRGAPGIAGAGEQSNNDHPTVDQQ